MKIIKKTSQRLGKSCEFIIINLPFFGPIFIGPYAMGQRQVLFHGRRN